MNRYAAVVGAILLFALTAWANPVDVDVYAGFTDVGGGTPFTGYVGTLDAPDVMFATDNGWAWHPFGLSAFGALITGYLDVAAAGPYTLQLTSDDGSMLYIDGALAIDNGGPHSPTIVFGTQFLSAGLHPFKIEFFEDFGGPSGVDLTLPYGVEYGVVPEPSTFLLLGPVLLGLLAVVRRRS